ncbi:LapA family protein [Lysobacter sp. CFH 32150]|uniref:LapA family protein n=1 Tax=Lysobacter sp. CFH 32150 TaxID=2927128 RepID=UPI001FA6DC91|nr:LapA family protein [Lysobacter sp. CFH 32150]MCI4566427.1 LapA family protein [Lysobacter sp. CFH 32150]
MRLIRLLIALACLAAGVAVGAMNPQVVALDLGFVAVSTTLGVAVIVALLFGVLVGGLVLAASVVLPLQQRLRRAEKSRNGL